MTSEAWAATIAAVISVLGFLASMGGVIFYSASRLARMDVKVDTLWDYVIRSALDKATSAGVVKTNSPSQATEKAVDLLGPMVEELRRFYRRVGVHLTERELFQEVAARFGDRLLFEVAKPNQISIEAVTLAAVEVAKKVSNDKPIPPVLNQGAP